MSTSNDKFLTPGTPLGLVDPCEVVATDAPSFGGARHEYIGLPIGGNDRKKAWLRIKFQKGPVKEHGVNGVQTEHVLRVAEDRLQDFQDGPFPCWQNELALAKIREALQLLHHRTVERRNAGVEGTDAALPVPSVVDREFDATWLKGELNDAAAVLGMCAHDLGLQPDTGVTYQQLAGKLGPIVQSLTAECYRMRKALADQRDHGEAEHQAAGCCFAVGPAAAGSGDGDPDMPALPPGPPPPPGFPNTIDDLANDLAKIRKAKRTDRLLMLTTAMLGALISDGKAAGRERKDVIGEAMDWVIDMLQIIEAKEQDTQQD